MIQGPVRLAVEFRFRRPLADYTAKGDLKPGVDRYYIKRKNDLDKCVRAICDSLSGVAYVDDCRLWTFTPSADIADHWSGLGLS